VRDLTSIKDLTPLQALTKLKVLYLFYTKVSEDQIEALQKALPELEIKR
jgi:hypothetical protein